MTQENPFEQLDTDHLAQARMSFFEHLTELRRRVIYSFIAVVIGFAICWFWVEELFLFLLAPLQIAASEEQFAQMHHKDLAEPFFALLKTAIVGGVFVASPAILYNLWRFIAPGLYPREKKIVFPFVFFATFFFFLGASFCYYIVIPYGYSFLLEFSLPVSQPALMMNEYFALTTKLLLGFGAVFEMPVLAMFLSIIGVITHRTLIKYWRVSVVLSFIMAAMLTPPDVITQAMMAVPLVILYLLSVAVAWYFTTRREARQAELDAQ